MTSPEERIPAHDISRDSTATASDRLHITTPGTLDFSRLQASPVDLDQQILEVNILVYSEAIPSVDANANADADADADADVHNNDDNDVDNEAIARHITYVYIAQLKANQNIMCL
uniref:Uncharacterized protein n=1 Tax=Glossina pallidipes TaxID=7398 RepID=A0A1B0A130_GLOPL